MAEQLGAQLVNMDVTYGPELRLVPPPREPFAQLIPASGPAARLIGLALPWIPRRLMARFVKRLLVTWQHPENALFDDGAILVNQQGERFCDERAWPEREIGVSRQSDKLAYAAARRAIDRPLQSLAAFHLHGAGNRLRVRRRLSTFATRRGRGRSHARRGRGGPAASRRRTERHRRGRQSCVARPRRPDRRWPAIAGCCSARSRPTSPQPKAASRSTSNSTCSTPRAQPIAGLYAVGQIGLGGQILWGHGLHIAWAMTSGRLVGELLARP